ncbi:rab15 effector protein isoform X2 [Oryzias melastigma]|nr:rab15 effector protein isoform X2 [Oryzias melastigma]
MGQKNSTPSLDPHTKHQPGIFTMLMKPQITKPEDYVPLISNCISAASARTQEYLLFKDPEDKFQPSLHTPTQVFLMTYITQSVNLTNTFNCTAMTPEQQILLGADWVWAILEKPTKNPKTQIAVQVLHLPERERAKASPVTTEVCSESIQMARMASRNKNACERMVDFCSSIGKDCYALFLFFGKTDDEENIYGVLSNNFDAAIGKSNKIDRIFIENFFKGWRHFYTPLEMIRTIFTRKTDDPLTLVIKFS